jgi:aspartyl-tRNA(Asn)/glutamyl-tRNA(Gln) amidotransferase subunit A
MSDGDSELAYLPATELVRLVRARTLSPVEIVDAALRRIDAINPLVNAYCTVISDAARDQARALEQAIQRGEAMGPLAGVPVSIKDLIATRGVRTTRGSRLFADAVPNEDAPVVERLRAAGAIILGKTNTPEFGWKGVTDNALFGPTRNPWHRERTSGGSSGGAGAAVAAGLGPLAIGTDGGGSVRIPASFCGIVGLKPTFGLVPAYPPSWAEALSHVGPMARTVADAALLLRVLAGPDPRDRNSYRPAPQLGDAGSVPLAGKRVAWSPNLGRGLVDAEVLAAAERAAARFEELGATVEAATPEFGDVGGLPWQVLFFGAIAAAVTGLPAGWEEQIDPGLRAAVQQARSFTGFDVARAYQARTESYAVARRFFDRYDLLLTPSVPAVPWAVGQNTPSRLNGKEATLADAARLTQTFNMTGNPAATVPCGWSTDGLPLGLQIVGRWDDDGGVLRAAAAFEALAPWAGHQPPLD